MSDSATDIDNVKGDVCMISPDNPIKLDTVRIMVDSNIPGKEPFELKRQMIFHPTLKTSSFKKMSDYPFITKDRCYQPDVSRFLNTLPYDKKLSFFFSKERQLKVFEDLKLYTSSRRVVETVKSHTIDDSEVFNSTEIKKLKDKIKENDKSIDYNENLSRTRIRQLDDNQYLFLKDDITYYVNEITNDSSEENKKKYRVQTRIEDNINKKINNMINEIKSITFSSEQVRNEYFDKKVKNIYDSLENIFTDKPEIVESLKIQILDIIDDDTNYEDGDFKDGDFKDGDFKIDEKIINDINSILDTLNGFKNKIIGLRNKNKTLNENIVKEYEKVQPQSSGHSSTPTTNNDNTNDIYVKNVKTMLEMLFPNSFPSLNNIKDSYSMLIKTNDSEESIFSWKNIYPKFLTQNTYPDQYYSYLQLDGKIYTTTQLIWLNDIFNHPKYKELIDKYEFFTFWKEQQKGTLATDLLKKQSLFEIDFSKDNSNNGKYKFTEADKDFFKDKKFDLASISGSDRSYSEKVDLNKNLDGIYKSIEQIETYLKITSKPEDVYKEILDSALAIRTLYKKVADKIIITKDIETKITRLISSITEINAIINIQRKFIDTNEIVLNYEAEDKSTVDELKEKYPEYVEFVDLFKTFIRPKRNTINTKLQETIEGFATGQQIQQTEFQELIQPNSSSSEITAKQATQLNILQAKANEPRFEIYIQLNLIGGKLNDNNQSRINCMYKSEYLGTELDHILHPSKKSWELSTKRLFFDLDEMEKKTKLQMQEQKQKEDAVSLKPPDKNPDIMPPMPPPIETNRATAAAAAGGSKKTRHRTLPIYPLRKTKKTRSR